MYGSPFIQPNFIATKHDMNNRRPDACSSCVGFFFVPFHPVQNTARTIWMVWCNGVRAMHLGNGQQMVLYVRAASRIAYVIRSLCWAHCAHDSSSLLLLLLSANLSIGRCFKQLVYGCEYNTHTFHSSLVAGRDFYALFLFAIRFNAFFDGCFLTKCKIRFGGYEISVENAAQKHAKVLNENMLFG